MEDLKQEYLAMRREKAAGYGSHSFEEGLTKTQLERECISILEERCKDFLGRFTDKQLQDKIETIIGEGVPQRKVPFVVRRISKLKYDQLVEMHRMIKFHFLGL